MKFFSFLKVKSIENNFNIEVKDLKESVASEIAKSSDVSKKLEEGNEKSAKREQIISELYKEIKSMTEYLNAEREKHQNSWYTYIQLKYINL